MRSCRPVRFVLLLLAAVLAVVPATANSSTRDENPTTQQPGLSAEDLYQLRSVGSVQISPDGSHVVYSVSERDRPGQSHSRLWLMNLESGDVAPLTGDAGGGSNPTWSPSGDQIAYFGRDGERSGLIVVRPDGSDARFLAEVQGTNHPLPSSGARITWAPDGTAIAFVSATPGPESEMANGDPVVITRYLYKPTASEGLTRFNDNRRMHIFVAELATGEVRQLTSGDYYEHSIDWSPDGSEILFISNREPDPDRFFNYDIFTVSARDGEIRRLTRTESAEYRPVWSPDGSAIAYQGTRRGLTSSETTMEDTHVWLVDTAGEKRVEIGRQIDNRQGAPQWSPDGSAVYFTVQDSGSVGLHRVRLLEQGKFGPPEAVVVPPGRVGSWSIAKGSPGNIRAGSGGAGSSAGPSISGDSEGLTLAYAFSSPTDLAQLFVASVPAEPVQMTDLNAELLRNRQIAEVEDMRFASFDGLEVQAFLTYPLGRTAGSRHPLVAMIKGGPHGQQGPHLSHKAQAYAAHGYAVLMVNYRGSTGHGQAFADAIFADQNGGEAKDVMYAVQAALRRYEWLDPERLGIEGGSYGGQLTNWIITQTDRFKAAIPIAGISNLVSFNYMAYYHDYLAVEFGGFPHEGDLMDVLWERSPLKHVAQVMTPVMLVHGENDNDVPIAEAEQFYIALRDVGVEAVMVRYPREGHGVRQTAHAVDLINRSIAWYDKHF
jgi:dipeptidyl aminopeptidase/acylaminoacyl peptidase